MQQFVNLLRLRYCGNQQIRPLVQPAICATASCHSTTRGQAEIMTVELLIHKLSSSSWMYRWTMTLVLSFVTMKASFDIFILNLATAEIPFHCDQAVLDNKTVAWSSLNVSDIAEANFSIADFRCVAPHFRRDDVGLLRLDGNSTCREWQFTPIDGSRRNMLMEFSFVCDRAYIGDRMQTIMQAGVFVSCSFGPLADMFGRKLPIVTFVYIDLISSISVIFVQNLHIQMVLRFFMGFGAPAVLTGLAYLTELVSEHYHGVQCNFYWILWTVGYTASGLVAYCIGDWRMQMVFVVCLVGSGYLTYWWTLVESPLWLSARGQHAAARSSLRRLFRRYGVSTSELTDLPAVVKETDDDNNSRCCGLLPRESVCQAKYLLVLLAFTFLFISNAMSYFSASFRRDFISRNPYLNVCINGLVELPAALVGWILAEKCGRRGSNVLLLLSAGLLLIALPLVPQADDVTFGAKSACALLAKFFMTVSFNLVLLFGSESLPTTIRATSFVVASQVMRLGQMATPELTSALIRMTPSLPNFFFGSFCLASALVVSLLPETHDRPVPSRVADMQNVGCHCAMPEADESEPTIV